MYAVLLVSIVRYIFIFPSEKKLKYPFIITKLNLNAINKFENQTKKYVLLKVLNWEKYFLHSLKNNYTQFTAVKY